MPRAEFFSRFGFLHAREFFDAGACRQLRDEIRRASGTPGRVRGRGPEEEVDQRSRRVTWAHVAPEARAAVEARLTGLKAGLERHFGLALTRFEDPSFLRYRPGDFYVPHRDRIDGPDVDPDYQGRRVSVVAFLNGEGDGADPETYGGGALTFTGLLADPRMRGLGIPLVGEPGLLVAFRSDVVHSVAPVTHGERFTIVTWYA